ncbi:MULTISPECIES: hypothetical protein [Streptococcus]|uniref:Uncharacterized protein n=1 Tax=Streptococcus macedonicus TaxID=59310 RepID=A0AA47FEA1_STRMC|nr:MULTISPECIES: hypothetical protein [Streptococcus]MCW8485971.1 hypothetical protein [Streptococcus macedonicus]MCW8494142.1 hypothetical protein [Streptococcus macedonicus]MCW8499451.1 hypothetical protein [Streptococcus macedonicus]MCW8501572.1 hypothetical protein [Streptococcus macedonicus]MCW8503514.1 hypothetical protein [Streptococcus macedonicus]
MCFILDCKVEEVIEYRNE